MKLGDQIASFRLENRMTQEDLAEILNVSRQAVTKWESSVSIPDLNRIIQLADFFGVSLDKMVGREETMYDMVIETLKDLSSRHVKADEFDFTQVAYSYITYLESLGIPAETIVRGLRGLCRAASES